MTALMLEADFYQEKWGIVQYQPKKNKLKNKIKGVLFWNRQGLQGILYNPDGMVKAGESFIYAAINDAVPAVRRNRDAIKNQKPGSTWKK